MGRTWIGAILGAALAVSAGAFGAGAARMPIVGLALSTLSTPFFVAVGGGAQAAAMKRGVTLIVFDAQDDPAKQASAIEDLIARKASIVIINPTDSAAVVPTVKKLNAARIPVVTIDRAADGGEVAAHIAGDNVAGGGMGADYVGARLGGQGNVVMLEGSAGSSAARDRGRGFREGIAKFPGIEIVASQTADFDRAEGLSVMGNILEAEKKVDAVFAQNDEMALGAVQAIAAAHREKEMFVVGFDGTAAAVKAISAGAMAATIAPQPKVMGQLAVETAVTILRGGKVAEFTPVPFTLVTK